MTNVRICVDKPIKVLCLLPQRPKKIPAHSIKWRGVNHNPIYTVFEKKSTVKIRNSFNLLEKDKNKVFFFFINITSEDTKFVFFKLYKCRIIKYRSFFKMTWILKWISYIYNRYRIYFNPIEIKSRSFFMYYRVKYLKRIYIF